MDLNKTVICPNCGSKIIYIDKKGFSTKKAVVGGLFTGNVFVAAAAGGIGANKIVLTCLDCGKNFKIGEGAHEVDIKLPSKAEVIEFERHVIPKEDMPETYSFECDCGRSFTGERNAYCPSCGRKMSEKNLTTTDRLKPKRAGCLGFFLILISVLMVVLI